MTIRTVKTGKTRDGYRVKVGDLIAPLDCHGNEIGTICQIKALRQQGSNGTIATLDPPPDPQYPHHYGHRVSQSLGRFK